ncbi:MAG: glutamine-hydrolyzing carbamoyl-phosphate synthase small subunit [Roseiflexaceae bacterium]|nr:glutamine-hydrolyzing carbamoyl-phosphate synthase small subunit [Roseiflexaceae bacterium]
MAPIHAVLALEDGTTWPGESLGATGERVGEIVFNTAMTGYQEILTDPSYYGQIVVMTVPHVGNTGINIEDGESHKAWLSGFVVREASRRVSSWRASQSLDAYLREQGVVAITGVDTRALVRHIRERGAMNAVIASGRFDPATLVAKAQAARSMEGADLVKHVTTEEAYNWPPEKTDEIAQWYVAERTENNEQRTENREQRTENKEPQNHRTAEPQNREPGSYHVVAYDFGIKSNILRLLAARGCRLTVVPADTPASEVLALDPDGVFLSNGPGDPAAVTYAIENTRALLGKKPLFGICLGHQILGLALGGSTYKLRFGHHGGNQPVQFGDSRRVEISSHNHGFAVAAASLPPSVEITHLNLNDNCVEGLRARDLRAFSVQYHPEAAPGPHDASYLFDQFVALMQIDQA